MSLSGQYIVEMNVEGAVELSDRNELGPIAVKTSVPFTAER